MDLHRTMPSVLLGGVLLLAGCGGGGAGDAGSKANDSGFSDKVVRQAPTPADPVFAGLDQQVVQEYLADHEAVGRYQHATNDADAMRIAQARVEFMTSCRAGYNALVAWRQTGAAPSLAPLPKPASSIKSGYEVINPDHETMRQALSDGDVNRLVSELTAEGGCGFNTPVKPGDTGGKRIDQAVRELMGSGQPSAAATS